MEWMLDIQLGRRNLSPIQRIAVAEKYRPIYEKQALNNKRIAMQEARKNNDKNKTDQISVILPKTEPKNTSEKLAYIAGVSEKTYRMGEKVLNSSNKYVKQRVLSGETSISAGYKELTQDKKEVKVNTEREVNNISSPTIAKPITPKTQISEETKQICADLKTEKTKEYLNSIWNYKVAIIDCMNADFAIYYSGFISTLNDMENRVTKRELNECIQNAEKYRPIYEKQAQDNLREGGRKGSLANSLKPSQISSKASNIDNDNKIDVRAKLAKTAGVSTDTYSKGKKCNRKMDLGLMPECCIVN